MIQLPTVAQKGLARLRERCCQPAVLNALAGLWFGTLLFHCIQLHADVGGHYRLLVSNQVFMACSALLLWHIYAGRTLSIARPLAITLGAFVACAWISSSNSPQPSLSFLRLAFYGGLCILAVAIYMQHRNNTQGAAGAYLLAIAVVHLLVFAIILMWLYSEHGGVYDNRDRLPFHANRRHFGYLGLLGATSAMALYAVQPKRAVVAFFLTVPGVFGIVLFGARGAFYAWLASVAVLLLLSKRRAALLTFALAAGISASGVCYAMLQNQWISAESLFARIGANAEALYSPNGRTLQWQDTLNGLAQRPWMGFGAEGYRASDCCPGGPGRYIPGTVQPHNIILQLLMEFGIVGFALLTCSAVFLARSFAKPSRWPGLVRNSSEIAGLSAVLAGLVALAAIDGTLYHPIPLICFSALTGLFFAHVETRINQVGIA